MLRSAASLDGIVPLRAVLLNKRSSGPQLAAACEELHRLFSTSTSAAARAVTTTSAVDAGGAVALSPSLAAGCLLDSVRTAAFVRGVHGALQEVRRRFPSDVIEVVYAGTGPFAPFALITALGAPPGRLRWTLLDIHEESIVSVRSLLRRYRLESFIRAVKADATTYVHDRAIHVVVSETMQRTLWGEPQVAIFRNLREQMAPGGVTVPEEVTIDLAMIAADDEEARWRGEEIAARSIAVGRVFHLGTEDDKPNHSDHATILTLVPFMASAPYWAALFTRIRIFGDEILDAYDSGLTVPEILWSISPITRATTLEFRYETEGIPRLMWREIDNPAA